jgi:hypothetical protein
MSITDDSRGNGFFMPVAPAYSGNGGMFGGMGGDWLAWFILVLLIGGNGWGMGGFGMGGMMPWLMGGLGGMGAGYGLDYLYPWLNNSQHISDGFRDQYLNTQIGDLRTDMNRGFGDVQLGQAQINQNICQTGNSISGAVRDGFSAAEIAANGRQMANMQTAFGLQTQLSQCCCDNRLATCQTQNIIQAEAAANRASGTADTQRILDKLCQLELDGAKREAAAKDEIIAQLRADNSALKSQSFIAAEINQQNEIFYNRLKNCPVNAVPVAGNTPLFNCNPGFNSSNGCGCGNGGNFR